MITVYQLLFVLALGLLAIMSAVFVFSVTLLGRAINISINEQQKAEQELKNATKDKTAELKQELEQATREERNIDIKRLNNTIRTLNIKSFFHNLKLAVIRFKPKLLGASWGVIIPGAFLLAS